MTGSVLQKSATSDTYGELPHEVLNPFNAGQHYSFQLYQPSAGLATFVEHYWIVRWDLRDKPAFIVEVIPAPYVNLTFMDVVPRITGVTTGKYTYKLEGKGLIVGTKFKPGGLYAFWQQDVAQLTDNELPAATVFSEADAALNTAILSLKTDRAMIEQVEALLLDKRPVADKNTQLINDVIASITDSDNPTVQSIAQKFGVSERSFQELFRTHVGVGLKWIIMRHRLQEAAKLAAKLEKPDWTTIATELGYSDQSHLINDFKRIIGKSPAQYAKATHNPM